MSNIDSSKIKIFPVAKDRGDSQPDATLFTEKNMTTWLKSVIDKKAFVVSGTATIDGNQWVVGPEPLVIYVDGYIVTVQKSEGENDTVLCKVEGSSNQLYVSTAYADSDKTELSQDDEGKYEGIEFSSVESSTSFLIGEYSGSEFVPQKYKINNSSVEDNWTESLEIQEISCIHPL